MYTPSSFCVGVTDPFLKVANRDTTLLDDPTSTTPPDMKGYLNKYANVAHGYNPRWIVLKNGILSCQYSIKS